MNLPKPIAFFFFFGLMTSYAQTNWYVNQELGDDSNTGLSSGEAFASVEHAVADFVTPGDTVLIIGTYQNSSYNEGYAYDGDINDPQIWKNGENSIKINELHGTEGAYITFKPYDNATVLKGDAANIFRVTNSSYLRIIGFQVEGEVENIPLETSLALQFLYRNVDDTESLYRVEPGTTDEEIEEMTFPLLEGVSRPSYTDTRGIYMSNVHHIEILKNHIHHTPGTGLRVADCDYIKIIGNELDNNSRRSYSGTHALVVTKANSMDTEEGYKIFIQKNEVHHNYNEIYSWAPTKTIITPRIDEGKGISLQRNSFDGGWTHGRFLVENNVTYWNGFSGVHSNTGARMDFVNNTAYFNSYSNTITYEDDPAGNNIGISTSNGDDIKIMNNVIYIDATWGGFPISSASTTDLVVANNLVYGVGGDLNSDADVEVLETGTLVANPQFVDSLSFNFGLKSTSPAINAADPTVAPMDDFYGENRDENPDLGAVEYMAPDDTGLEMGYTVFSRPYPNPFIDATQILFHGDWEHYAVRIYDISGKICYSNENLKSDLLEVKKMELGQGVFLMQVLHKETNLEVGTVKLVAQ